MMTLTEVTAAGCGVERLQEAAALLERAATNFADAGLTHTADTADFVRAQLQNTARRLDCELAAQ